MSLAKATAPVIDEANHALSKAIRNLFVERGIPLNTKYDVRVASDLDDPAVPIKREVWVYQQFPKRATFKLITEELKVIINESGANVEQNITAHDSL